MVKSKALWLITGARDFNIVYDWAKRVNFIDKLLVRNYMAHEAHNIGMKYFFEHDYDYLIVNSDDGLVTPSHIQMLLEDEVEHGFPVVSGWCNVKLDKSWASVSLQPHDGIATRTTSFEAYHLLDMSDLILGKYGYPFMKVWFVGLSLTLITKETLKKVPFRAFLYTKDNFCTTLETRLHGRGVMQDLQFAIDCAANNIPIIVDTRIFILHFGMTTSFVQVGKAKPTIEVIEATQPL